MFQFAHISDSHVRPEDARRSRVLVEQLADIESFEVAFMVHTGDLMEEPSEWSARTFGTLVSGLPVPLHVVPGNHDVYNPVLGEVEAPWWARLSVDSERERRYKSWFGPSWYEFRHEGVRFVALDSLVINSGLPEEEAQWVWLESALTAAAARGEPIVMFTHLPLFIRDPGEELDPTDFHNRYLVMAPPGRDRLMALIRKHRVIAVLSGHIHCPHRVAHRWPEGFTTHFVATGTSGWPSSMAIEHFDLPRPPEEGLGFHVHRIGKDGLVSEYHPYAAEAGSPWTLGPGWWLDLPEGEAPPTIEGRAWHEGGRGSAQPTRPTEPPWRGVNGEAAEAPGGAGLRVRYYVCHVAAEGPKAAVTLDLTTQDGALVYVNGTLRYELEPLLEMPEPWSSAGGTWTIESPRLSLPLSSGWIHEGTNVVAIRLDGSGETKTSICFRREGGGEEEDTTCGT